MKNKTLTAQDKAALKAACIMGSGNSGEGVRVQIQEAHPLCKKLYSLMDGRNLKKIDSGVFSFSLSLVKEIESWTNVDRKAVNNYCQSPLSTDDGIIRISGRV